MTKNKKYARQSFLGPDSEEVLAASCAGIIGLGGGGSHVVQQFAHAGVGTFELFDDDVMGEPNLNRTVGSEPKHAETAAKKVDVAAEMILRINPAATINRHYGKWEEHHLALRSCDAVVGCVDGFATRDSIERYCRRYLLPYIDIGMDVTKVGKTFLISGQVITSLPGRPCMRCMGFITDALITAEIQRYGAAGSAPQVVWSNGVLASTAVGIFMRLRCNWTGRQPAQYLEYDGNRDTMSQSARELFVAGRKCPHHDSPAALGDAIWLGMP